MDCSGNLVNGYVYDPFDNLFEQNETVANPWQYASGYLDSTTGLYHFGARYYDPTLGRWTQEDPIPGQLSNPDSLNPYLYVNDSPVNGTDPSGKYNITGCEQALFNTGFFGALSAAGGAWLVFGLIIPWLLTIGAATSSALIGAIVGLLISGLGAFVAIGLIVFVIGLVAVIEANCG